MITIKNITMKNFMSVGNVTQSIILDQQDIILVLGENMDLGGNDNRNGCGKTTILNALSYGLFGEPLTKIKMNNLINKINGKNMVVTVDFEKDGINYHIERGRKPDTFVYKCNGDDQVDQAQGDGRITQQEIERTLGLNHLMFKHIVALNTYTIPFLSSPAADQRQIIEDLLGISTLSEKAELLKAKIKATKDDIKEEDSKLKVHREYNENIKRTINSLESKKCKWDSDVVVEKESLIAAMSHLVSLDIDGEIANHRFNSDIDSIISIVNPMKQLVKTLNRDIGDSRRALTAHEDNIVRVESSTCPTCKQHLHNKDDLLQDYVVKYETECGKLETYKTQLAELTSEIESFGVLPEKVSTFYSSMEEALIHKNTIDNLNNNILKLESSINPYTDQINSLNGDIRDIDYSILDALTSTLEHQEFLLKLLTNKDSFIRKKIISQNIAFLNARIEYYLNKIGLPHDVSFLPDLDVEISLLGKELDFDNLSRGERTRLILAMSWSFRDCYESLNQAINIMFVDELIDTGLDSSGVESSLSILKDVVRKSKKTVFLISHRDELLGRIDTTLKVVKENGFTSFEQN
jgi:DNA repair exonuclease SbcCD ATPase subunit